MIKRAILIVIAVGAVVLPLLVVRDGADAFRLPKELVFRGEAIMLLALLILGWPLLRTSTRRPALMVVGAIVGWTIIVTATSTNRALSIDSLITVIAAAAIFTATCVAAETLSLEAVDVLMIGCCVNASITILQELSTWTPVPGAEGHYGSVGLMGNANIVGTFLVAPAVAAVVMAVTSLGRRRWIYLAIAVLLVSGMVASATRTALMALVAAMIVLAVTQARRAALVVGAMLLVVGLAMLTSSTTIGRGVRELAEAARQRDYQRLFSERLVPFLAAAEMTRDHPLLGVGPGCFPYHFMAYRVALTKEYPREWTQGFPMNWGSVHNDHLQVAAEAGVVGYLLFLAALAVVARRTAGGGAGPRAVFARALRWPLITAIFIVCGAQFPLELAAPRLIFLTLAALCVTWNGPAGTEPEVGADPLRGKNDSRWRPWRLGFQAIVIVVACIGIHRLCVIPFRDNRILRDIEQRLAIAQNVAQSGPLRAAPLARANLADLDGIARSQRLNPAWYVFYGANCELLGRWQEAANTYTAALAIDQRPEIYFYRGLVLLHLGRIDRAAADMITAVRFNPSFLDQIDGELRARVAAAAGVK